MIANDVRSYLQLNLFHFNFLGFEGVASQPGGPPQNPAQNYGAPPPNTQYGYGAPPAGGAYPNQSYGAPAAAPAQQAGYPGSAPQSYGQQAAPIQPGEVTLISCLLHPIGYTCC